MGIYDAKCGKCGSVSWNLKTSKNPRAGGDQEIGLVCRGCERMIVITAHSIRWDAAPPDKVKLKEQLDLHKMLERERRESSKSRPKRVLHSRVAH